VIESLIEQGWAEHDKDSAGVFERTSAAIPTIDDAKHLPAVAALIVHAAGEHLGRFREALAALDRLAALPVHRAGSAEAQALLRSRAALLLAAGDRAAAEDCIERAHAAGLPVASTRARVLAVASAALAGQRQTPRAIALFEEALALAAYGPKKDDPAARALAVTGNNLAASLEEKPGRSAEEDRLLELASKTGRRFWEIAGTWLEVERAEYRLAMSYLALGRASQALVHAKECRAICEKNGADDEELKYAREVVSKAEAAVGGGNIIK